MHKKIFSISEIHGDEYYSLEDIHDLKDLYINYIPEEIEPTNFVDIEKLCSELKEYDKKTINEYLIYETKEYAKKLVRENCFIYCTCLSCFGFDENNEEDVSIFFTDGKNYIDYNSYVVFNEIEGKLVKNEKTKVENIKEKDILDICVFYKQRLLREHAKNYRSTNFRKLSRSEFEDDFNQTIIGELGIYRVDEILSQYDEMFGFESEDYKVFINNLLKNIKTSIKKWVEKIEHYN